MAYHKIRKAVVNPVGGQTDAVVVAAEPGKVIRVVAAVLSPAAATPPASAVFNTKPAGAGVAISPVFGLVAGVLNVLPPDDDDGWFDTVRGEGLTVSTGAGAGAVGIEVRYTLV